MYKQYPEGTVIHKHHIIPKHWFNITIPVSQQYLDSSENIILLSREDHFKAHEILYKLYVKTKLLLFSFIKR